jgi:3-oxoacyl-[acyl-carrier protein] reductase
MDLGLRNKGVVVTGGSKGIGRSIVHRFAEEGAKIAICARGVEALEGTKRELADKGADIYACSCDVGSADALYRFLETAHEKMGAVDILVNNASGFGLKDDENGWLAGFNVDMMAAVRAAWKVVPWMKQGGGGAIVNISSVSGLEGGWTTPYSAAKAALVSLSKNLSITLAPLKIRVNTVAPGSIEYPGGAWEQIRQTQRDYYDKVRDTIPLGRMGTPEEIADVVAYLASERASWVNGVCLCVDGGQYKANV